MQERETRLPLETKEMNIDKLSQYFRKILNASNSNFKGKQRNLAGKRPHSKEAQSRIRQAHPTRREGQTQQASTLTREVKRETRLPLEIQAAQAQYQRTVEL